MTTKANEEDWKCELQNILYLKGRAAVRIKVKPISNRTLATREATLFLCMRQLHELGFDIQSINSIKGKHIEALVERWMAEGIAAGTIQNRLTTLRTLCSWLGKSGIVQRTEKYGEGHHPDRLKRAVVATEDKSWSAKGISPEAMIRAANEIDRHVGLQMKVIHAFGLRREEAVQFKPHKVDEGDVLRIRDGTKGGRERMVPVENDYQRQVLQEAKGSVSKWDSHIGAPGKTLKQNLDRFSYVMKKLGLTKKGLGATAHGLRHQRLNDIFEEIAGVPSPVRQMTAGGEGGVTKGDPYLWKRAQQKVSHVAGHARLSISTAYTGSPRSVASITDSAPDSSSAPRLQWTYSSLPITITPTGDVRPVAPQEDVRVSGFSGGRR